MTALGVHGVAWEHELRGWLARLPSGLQSEPGAAAACYLLHHPALRPLIDPGPLVWAMLVATAERLNEATALLARAAALLAAEDVEAASAVARDLLDADDVGWVEAALEVFRLAGSAHRADA